MCWFYTLPAIRNHIFAILALLIFQFVLNGYAIKCFVCDSTENPSCEDPKSNKSLVSEECTLDNMKSSGSWLFQLNELSFFNVGGQYSNPLFTCQKVVAFESKHNRHVTARFCQLHAALSDPCKILESKMNKEDNRDNRNYYKRSSDDDDNNKNKIEHCSICEDDNCNAAGKLFSKKENFILYLFLVILPLVFHRCLFSTFVF